MYKRKTIHNYLDKDNNCILSIRKANIEGMQNFLNGEEILVDTSNFDWYKDIEKLQPLMIEPNDLLFKIDLYGTQTKFI